MADEKNKNLNHNQDTVSNQAEPGRTPDAVGKLPLNKDVDQTTDHLNDIPGMPSGQSGRKGNVSVQDGGQTDGNSAGSH